ncbi:MAG: chromosome partitioning protein ParA [Rickettsiales bacterium]|nr:chromosome partitioning protein ParA [Rickettsiales bacterium]
MQHPSPRILAIVNQKGGVGKTTTAVNMATALAAIGKKVLLIDLDPQGNASTGLGVDSRRRTINSYHVLIDQRPLSEAVIATDIPRLDIVPANIDLSAAEIELVAVSRREYQLANIVQQSHTEHDYILIDCPPSLGLITLNALTCSDSVIIPLQCEFYALEGLSHLLKTIKLIQHKLNPALTIHGVVLTMYDRRNKLTEHIEHDVRSFMGEDVYQTVIPRNVRISEAPSHGKPAIVYDLNCAGSKAYLNLAKELIQREKRWVKAQQVA